MLRVKLAFLSALGAFFIQETHSYIRVVTKVRIPEYPVLPIIIKRWSSRVMSGEPIEHSQLLTLLEAAGWAPSSFNEQPWRFIYAMRDTPEWETLFSLLVPFNQEWAKNAAALVVIISKKTFSHNGTTNPVYLFDAGAAWMGLALQAQSMGLFAHGMAGFDYERARYKLGLSDDFDVCAMIAIGHPGSRKEQEKEELTLRRPVRESSFKAPEIHVFPEPPAPTPEISAATPAELVVTEAVVIVEEPTAPMVTEVSQVPEEIVVTAPVEIVTEETVTPVVPEIAQEIVPIQEPSIPEQSPIIPETPVSIPVPAELEPAQEPIITAPVEEPILPSHELELTPNQTPTAIISPVEQEPAAQEIIPTDY